MEFTEYQKKVEAILQTTLPRGDAIVAEGRAVASDTIIGRTMFMDEMGVGSEAEYKRWCIKDGTIMFHAHIGMNSWESTAEALARGDILRALCRQRGIEILEGSLRSYPHAFEGAAEVQHCVIGFLKGKSAVRFHRTILRDENSFPPFI